jgi:hypothetical protein
MKFATAIREKGGAEMTFVTASCDRCEYEVRHEVADTEYAETGFNELREAGWRFDDEDLCPDCAAKKREEADTLTFREME